MAREADVAAMKEEIKSMKLELLALDKKGSQLMKAKKNLWLELGVRPDLTGAGSRRS